MNLDLHTLLETIAFLSAANTSAWRTALPQQRRRKKGKSSVLVKPTAEQTNCFLNYFASLREEPATFLEAGTGELILLMSPLAEPILYPPELKVTSGTLRHLRLPASRAALPPPEVWIHVIIQSRHLVITNGAAAQ